MSEAGSQDERMLRMASFGIEASWQGSPWTRDNSTLVVIIVASSGRLGKLVKDENEDTLSYFKSVINAHWDYGRTAKVYGIVTAKVLNSSCHIETDAGDIVSIAQDSGGFAHDLCAADYSPVLEKISQGVEGVLTTHFTLRGNPEGGEVRIFVDGKEIKSGFSVTGRVVVFSDPPKKGAKIVVYYR